jgi:putative tricarboxylic transport membrane protein
MSHIKNMNDVMAGLALIAIAAFALVIAWPLNPGSTAAMGPGYFPRMLCFIQIALGAGIVVQGFNTEGEPFERWFPRQLFWILASIIFFAVTIEPLGLVIAVAGVVLVSALGNRGTKIHEAVLVAIGMALFAVLTFPVGLGLPIRIWPAAFGP